MAGEHGDRAAQRNFCSGGGTTTVSRPTSYSLCGTESARQQGDSRNEALRCADIDGPAEPWEEFWASNILDQPPFGHFRP